MFHNERYYVRFKRYSNYFVKTCIWVKSSPITTKQSYFHIRVKYMRWQKKYKLLAVAKQLRRFPNWNMSNREFRNRLDRARQIRCSVRWEGEEGTGEQPWAPCIAPHTPNMHCDPYTQVCTSNAKQIFSPATFHNSSCRWECCWIFLEHIM